MSDVSSQVKLNDKKVTRSWLFYDWANSVYSLTITSATFPVYYNAVTSDATKNNLVNFFGWNVDNNVLYSYALSFSFLIVSLILPILSGLADFSQSKKFFMKIFVYLGSLSCIGLYFFTGGNIEWGIICMVLASIGYSGSIVFYDAFLPEIATEDQFDKLSAKGYGYGYVGSVILLVLNLVLILSPTTFGFEAESTEPVKLGFLAVGIWWLGFSFIPFAYLPKDKGFRKVLKSIPKNQRASQILLGYKELKLVTKEIQKRPNILKFLIAYFFYNMGVQTVMYLAATFGSDELNLESDQLIITVLLLNVVAIFGAMIFAQVSKRIGNIKTLAIIVFVWMIVSAAAYFVYTVNEFYIVAGFIGFVMGGVQSMSRSTYSKLLPRDTKDNASFFMFYDVTFNLSIVLGTFTYGIVNQLTGSMRNSVLFLCVFFFIGLLLLRKVKISKPINLEE